MKLTISDKKIEYDNLFFCFAIALSSVVGLVVPLIRLVVPNTFSMDTLLIYALFAFVLFKAWPALKKRIGLTEILALCAVVIVFSFSLLNKNADMSLTWNVLIEIATDCLLVYLAAKVVRFTPVLTKYMRISAIITMLHVILKIYVFAAEDAEAGYSQYDGYLLLIAMAFIFVCIVQSHKVIDFVLAVVNLIAVLLTGARGPFVLCVILLLLAMILVVKNKKYLVLSIVATVAIAAVVVVNLEDILLYILNSLDDSASTRTIEMLLGNNLFEDVARDKLFENAFAYIGEHVFLGCGVVNDRVILHDLMPSLGEVIGCYPHNFFVEMMMQFGAFGGVLLSVAFLFFAGKRFLSFKLREERIMLIALAVAGFAPLMATGSYLGWPMFFALLGFLVRKPSARKAEETND